ncbi:hypothetical protein [Acinetobacter johnsonii]|uniref:hypothetical protein n=1 Tax=Acinetobacter johnsonii TaxID=40214 RepID=UPI00244A4A0E|nr:hypothetical protein [Acinetobacter johnsonii]MDH2046232.1 hypothetical protein [Acinetobacter johnsonii]
MKYTAISQYQPFLFIKLATPFHFVRLSKMNTLNKSLCAALLAVAATSSFAAETQVVETTQNAAPASEAAASDAVATSEAQAN